MSKCRSCGAPIRWAITTGGASMPLDLEPNPDGNVVMTGRSSRSRMGTLSPEVEVIAGAPLPGLEDSRERFMPHHATCPDADEWRR